MKAVVLFPIVVLVGALPTVASAQVAPGCAQVVQNINNLASTIAGGASSYWSHRKNFVELKFGPSSLAVPNAAQLAEQEKIQADPLKAAMPSTLARFKALVATARSQNCLPPAQLSAFVERVIKLAKGVNFDQFPENHIEGGAQTPPRMPKN
jgi:hypothetical protein